MEQTRTSKSNMMATASLILAVIAFFCVFNVFRAVFFGSMSILFAVLSRGSGFKMPDKAVGGFATAAIAIVLSITLTAASMYLLVKIFGAETAFDPDALQDALLELYNNLVNSLPAEGGSL